MRRDIAAIVLLLAGCSGAPTGGGSSGATPAASTSAGSATGAKGGSSGGDSSGSASSAGASSASSSAGASSAGTTGAPNGTSSGTGTGASTSAGASSASGGSSGGVSCGNGFAQAVLADGPIAYYPMDEITGSAMADDAASPVPGSYGAAVALGRNGLVPTSAEAAPHFPGGAYAAQDVAQVPSNAQLQAGTAFSVEFVLEEDQTNPGSVSDGFIDLATYEWSVQIDPKNLLHLWLPTSATNLQVAGKTSITPGVPHLVDATYDGTTASLYLDGQLEGTAQGSGALDFTGLDGTGLSVAGSALAPSRSSLAGQIAQLSLYAVTLSSSRIAAHYAAAGLPGPNRCGSATSGGGSSGGATGTASSGGSSGPSGGSTSGGSAGSQGPGFPRLASMLIATTGATQGQSVQGNGYDASYVQWASKMSVNLFGANWSGAGSGMYGGSREAFVQAVHAQSTIGAQMFEYYVTDNDGEMFPMTDVSSFLLYEVGTSGTCSPNGYNSSWCNTNQTLYPPADANGLHLEGEFAQAILATYVNGSSVDAAPSLDGTFHDNTILVPTASGDYARNGTTEQAGDPTVGQWLRDGFAEGYGYLHAHSKLITLGNIGGWGIPNATGGGTNASGLTSLVQGGTMEGTFGDTFSAETWGGFAVSKAQYQFSMANTAAPHLVMVCHDKLAANGSDPVYSNGHVTGSSPPYQAMRYSLAFALMDDGYYATTQQSYYNTERNWFDEFAVDPTTGVALAFPNVDAGLGYLGQPTDAPWPAPLASGVYERHFANAAAGSNWLVLLNPKGNGAQTVQLGQAMQKLTGTQDPATNDGSTVTSVTLQDRDGLILMGP